MDGCTGIERKGDIKRERERERKRVSGRTESVI